MTTWSWWRGQKKAPFPNERFTPSTLKALKDFFQSFGAKAYIAKWSLFFKVYNCDTDSTQINRPGRNIRMYYWTSFESRQIVVHILTLLLVPFASKLFNYSWHNESLKINKSLSWKENVGDLAILPNVQRLTVPCQEYLTDLGAKCAKRSVKIWNANFYKSLFKYILLYMNGQLTVKNSFRSHVWLILVEYVLV